MQYTKVEVGQYNPIHSFRDINPFTTAFCRTMEHGNVMVVGGYNDVKKHVATLGPALVSFAYWHHGKSRVSHRFMNIPFDAYFHRHRGDGWDAILAANGFKKQSHIFAHYRKIPSTFPKLLKELLEK